MLPAQGAADQALDRKGSRPVASGAGGGRLAFQGPALRMRGLGHRPLLAWGTWCPSRIPLEPGRATPGGRVGGPNASSASPAHGAPPPAGAAPPPPAGAHEISQLSSEDRSPGVSAGARRILALRRLSSSCLLRSSARTRCLSSSSRRRRSSSSRLWGTGQGRSCARQGDACGLQKSASGLCTGWLSGGLCSCAASCGPRAMGGRARAAMGAGRPRSGIGGSVLTSLPLPPRGSSSRSPPASGSPPGRAGRMVIAGCGGGNS